MVFTNPRTSVVVIRNHSVRIASMRAAPVGRFSKRSSLNLIKCHTFSMGLRSGELAGYKLMILMLRALNADTVLAALCGGALSCI